VVAVGVPTVIDRSGPSLAIACYDAAGCDPELALLLAVDFIREHGSDWRSEDEEAEAA
jgi:hypothetical protein